MKTTYIWFLGQKLSAAQAGIIESTPVADRQELLDSWKQAAQEKRSKARRRRFNYSTYGASAPQAPTVAPSSPATTTGQGGTLSEATDAQLLEIGLVPTPAPVAFSPENPPAAWLINASHRAAAKIRGRFNSPCYYRADFRGGYGYPLTTLQAAAFRDNPIKGCRLVRLSIALFSPCFT